MSEFKKIHTDRKSDVNKSAPHKDAFKSDFQKKDFKIKDFGQKDYKRNDFKRDSFQKPAFRREEKKGLNPKDQIAMIKDLANVLSEKGLEELELTTQDAHIRLSKRVHSLEYAPQEMKRPKLSTAFPDPHARLKEEEQKEKEQSVPQTKSEREHRVTSPCVGTAYLKPAPDVEPFVQKGMRIEKGADLLIIEAMKVMNTIAAPVSGTITDILVDNEQPVEFGQSLVLIESD